MEFRPRLADDTVNVTRRHPLSEASWLLGGVLLVAALLVVAAAYLSDLVVWAVSPEDEARWLGDLATAVDDAPGDADPALDAQLTTLTARLAAGWPSDPYRHQVRVVDAEEPNAFAFPGGGIVVTQGLLDEADSENEVAFVLGHELGHFRERDHLRGLSRGLLTQVLLTPLLGGSAGQLGDSVAEMGGLHYGRRQEERADAFGLELVARLYGHVAGADAFFARMAKAKRLPRWAQFQSTHPLSEARVAALHALSAQRGHASEGELTPFRAAEQ